MELKNRNVYSFSVYPVALLGNDFTNVTVLVATLDEETARQTIDTYALHRQYYPFLPPDTPDDPTAYDYVKIRTVSGETRIIGRAWINDSTIELVDKAPWIIELTDVSPSDLPRIREMCAANRFKVAAIRRK